MWISIILIFLYLGIPVIVMTDYVAYSLYLSSDMADETDLLLVMPFGPRTRGRVMHFPSHCSKLIKHSER